LILAVTDEPQSTRAWASGARGEEQTGRWLDQLASAGAISVLHDRRIPRSRANIDHIAITPSGVFVVDSKRWRGRIERRSTGSILKPGPPALYVAGRDRTHLAAGVRNQVEVVSTAIADSGHTDIDATGVLLFTTGDFALLAKPFAIDGIQVHWPRSLTKRLTQPGEHPRDAVTSISRHLDRTLPPA
jgi:hypothetical protein